MTARSAAPTNGLPFALAAYGIWGLVPLYFHALRAVPPLEVVSWRAILTVPLCLAIIALCKQGAELRLALSSPKIMLQLVTSGTLVAANWLIFVMAVTNGHVLAGSLGYYINPLVTVLLGTVLLGEKLSRRQWLAVSIAALGVALLAHNAIDMLGIAMSLALTFGFYGLVRKLVPVGAVTGLTIETTLLLPAALAAIAWYGASPAGSGMTIDPQTTLLLLCAGAVTGIPLLLFAEAARRMDLSTLGFVQFLSPTITFVLGVFVFGETLDPVRLACFVLIWSAIALFSFDMIARRRAALLDA